MSVMVILVDGPAAGKFAEVTDLNDVLYMPYSERIDISKPGLVIKQYMNNYRRAAYRARRIASTGHIVHERQLAVFEYVGDR